MGRFCHIPLKSPTQFCTTFAHLCSLLHTFINVLDHPLSSSGPPCTTWALYYPARYTLYYTHPGYTTAVHAGLHGYAALHGRAKSTLGSEASLSLGRSPWCDYPAQSCYSSSRILSREECGRRSGNGRRSDRHRAKWLLITLVLD